MQVETTDFMTAEVYYFDSLFLKRVSSRITNEVEGMRSILTLSSVIRSQMSNRHHTRQLRLDIQAPGDYRARVIGTAILNCCIDADWCVMADASRCEYEIAFQCIGHITLSLRQLG